MNEKEKAEEIIKELQDAGLNYDQMIEVIQMARKKHEAMREADFYHKLEEQGWKDINHVGHLIYKKDDIEYAVCCETLYTKQGNKPMTKKEFEEKYLI